MQTPRQTNELNLERFPLEIQAVSNLIRTAKTVQPRCRCRAGRIAGIQWAYMVATGPERRRYAQATAIGRQAQAFAMEQGESTVPEVGERMVRPGIWKREVEE